MEHYKKGKKEKENIIFNKALGTKRLSFPTGHMRQSNDESLQHSLLLRHTVLY